MRLIDRMMLWDRPHQQLRRRAQTAAGLNGCEVTDSLARTTRSMRCRRALETKIGCAENKCGLTRATRSGSPSSCASAP